MLIALNMLVLFVDYICILIIRIKHQFLILLCILCNVKAAGDFLQHRKSLLAFGVWNVRYGRVTFRPHLPRVGSEAL